MLNRTQLIGRLTSDPKKEFLNSKGERIAKVDFDLAVNIKDKVQCVPCVAFRTQADNLAQYTRKGSRIYAEGPIDVQKYTNNNKETKTYIRVVVKHIIFLDPKN
ncbi:Single-strand DNA-binding protein of phage [Candidatus Phytoplasma australiense]|uniref:Single-stranded DNA-binding protein n=1 Tax=Phytoplasma australiense TaxID=59748 RepID=B1VAT5_PHYAS|nr:Single-strand DNA-binding protein of phage [Candidatus Phytoplasma australiense]